MPLTNLFQSQLDQTASPLLTTPSPLKRLPMTPATPSLGAALHTLPAAAGGLNISHLLNSLGGSAAATRPTSAVPPLAKPTAVTSNDPSLRASAPSSSGWVAGVVRAAHQAGVDPVRAVAIALEESGGDPRAVGDQGSSYGLFQLHKGGALGSMSPQAAFDPYTNAMAVLPSWAKLGGGQGLSDRAALMQYYHGVGRGSSDTIPTDHALAKLDQARALVGGAGTAAPAATGQTLMERTTGGGGLTPQIFGALLNYASKIQKDALAGKAPDISQVMRMVDPIMKAIMAPTGEVQSGLAPPTDPGSSGREHVATQAALSVLGTPYRWGGTDPYHGIDCSALVQWAWGKAGVALPRTTYEQIKVGQPVPNLASAQPGDILFPSAGHEMLYLGNGIAVESPHTGASVRQTNVAGRTFLAIRRPG